MVDSIYYKNAAIKSFAFGNLLKSFEEKYLNILNTTDSGFALTGTWGNSSILGYLDSLSKYSTNLGATAKWSLYAPKTGNYIVYAWIVGGTSVASVQHTITSLDGVWRTYLDQNLGARSWVKIAVISAVEGTSVEVAMEAVMSGNTRVNAIKIESTNEPTDLQYDPTQSQSNEVAVFINQSGYDTTKAKRATITNVVDGTSFVVKKASDATVVYTGTTLGQIADFTSYQPSTTEEYYIECATVTSYPFKIGKYWTQRVTIKPTLRFMDKSRQDVFNVGGNTGYGWRDSHQFSFELNSLALQYMANPSAYDRMPYGISNLSTSEYPELRTQAEPDIIWLMKFGALRYYDYKVNHGYALHALVKEQLAYFLAIYPDISQYVSQAFYEQIRDMTIAEWSNPNCTLQWYEVGDSLDNNLFETQRYIGDIKGQKPPGHVIVPNLLMYEVALRDGLPNAQAYFDAAYNNCAWLINSVDLDDPQYTKGQRMSERITIEALAYFQENYPTLAPAGLQNKINRWVDVMISRSDNLWDLRKHSDPDDITVSTLDQWTGGGNQFNEAGNVAGFMAEAYAAERVTSDETKKARLKALGIAHNDNVFGRNPFGRHQSYNGPTEIEGVDVGWFTFYNGGYGDLGSVIGVLDGSPKESAYPFNPSAPYGYTEGWVAFNAAWNDSLAYSAADDLELKVFNSDYTVEISSASVGSTLGIKLKAPLNFSEVTIETGEVIITDNLGVKTRVAVTEASVDDFYFLGQYIVPSGVTSLTVSYGLGFFKVEKIITIA